MTDRELYELIDVEDMLKEMGIRNVRDTGSGEVEFSCPFPGHNHLDSRPSASMSKEERPAPDGDTYPKTSFYCFTCGARGSAITFLADYENTDPITAKRWLKERFAPAYVESGGSTEEKVRAALEPKKPAPVRKTQILPESTLDQFWINWPEVWDVWQEKKDEELGDWALVYFFRRGFHPTTLINFDIGFDEISSRFTIPARDADGKLLGFKGRAWWPDAFPKYKVLGGEKYDFETYEVSRCLWGLHIAKNQGRMILREGELNAMKLHEVELNHSVGISGKRMSAFQKELIKEYATGLIVWMDDLKDSIEIATKLQHYMPVFVVPETDKDPADSTKEEIHEAVASAESVLTLQIVR